MFHSQRYDTEDSFGSDDDSFGETRVEDEDYPPSTSSAAYDERRSSTQSDYSEYTRWGENHWETFLYKELF